MLILATSKIQSNYQTTIPKEIRKSLDIKDYDAVEIFATQKGIFIKKKEINFQRIKQN